MCDFQDPRESDFLRDKGFVQTKSPTTIGCSQVLGQTNAVDFKFEAQYPMYSQHFALTLLILTQNEQKKNKSNYLKFGLEISFSIFVLPSTKIKLTLLLSSSVKKVA